MQKDLFISYSRSDLDAVKPIKEELETSGFSYWIDLEGVESGSDDFKKIVIPAIRQSKVFLFFLSNSSQQSENALKEIRFAKKRGKKPVLVRINDDQLTDEFEFDFGDTDIIDWRKPEQKGKLLADLRRWTASATVSQPSVTPSPETCSGEHEKTIRDMLSSLGCRYACLPHAARKIDVLASEMVSKYTKDDYGVQRLSSEQGEQRVVLVQMKDSTSHAGKYIRLVMGLSAYATIRLLRKGDDLEITVFGGNWIDKICVTVVALFIFWPILVIPSIGAYRQKRFLDSVYNSVIHRVRSLP